MKCIVIISALVVLCASTKFPTDHDDFDLSLLNDKAYLLNSVKCYLDEGPCDEVIAFFKKYMPEVIRTACTECNDKQKNLMKVFYGMASAVYPEDMKRFNLKYDPTGEYIPALASMIN